MRSILLAFVVGITVASAQPSIEWSRTFDGDYATSRAIAATVDGGAVLAGNEYPRGATVRPFVHKLSPDGEIEWTWNGNRDFLGVGDVAITADGRTVLLIGPSSLDGRATGSPSVVWLDQTGAFEREVFLEVEGLDIYARGLSLTPGGVAVVGWTPGDDGEPRALLLTLEDGAGLPRAAVLEVGRMIQDVVPLHGGGLAVVGNERPGPRPTPVEGFVARIEDDGEIVWAQLTAPPFLWVDAGVGMDGGGIAVVGDTAIYPDGAGAPVARIGPDGDLEWARTVRVLEVAKPQGIANGPDGGLVVVGTAEDDSTTVAFFAGLDGDGETAWTLTTDPNGGDWGTAVARAADGGHFVAGQIGVGLGVPNRPAVWKLASQARRLSASAHYDARQDAPLVLRNETHEPISLDSLAIGRGLGDTYLDWIVAGRYPSGGFFSADCGARVLRVTGVRCEMSGSGGAVAPGQEVELRMYFDCLTCRLPPDITDVLEVYSGGDADPVRVRVEADIPVSVLEGASPQLLALEVSPNPTAALAVLEVATQTGDLEVVAFDALGRHVAVLHDGPATGSLRLEVDTRDWPVGVYVVRASSRSSVSSTRLVVAR